MRATGLISLSGGITASCAAALPLRRFCRLRAAEGPRFFAGTRPPPPPASGVGPTAARPPPSNDGRAAAVSFLPPPPPPPPRGSRLDRERRTAATSAAAPPPPPPPLSRRRRPPAGRVRHRARASSYDSRDSIPSEESGGVRAGETATATATAAEGGDVAMEPLYDPATMFDGTIPYPRSLSPSSAREFKSCPQSYLFQYLYGIKQPTNPALARGTVCHAALERVFDLDPPDRTSENLRNLLRVAWSESRTTDEYAHLFGTCAPSGTEGEGGGGGGEGGAERDDDDDAERAEREWGRSALRLLDNYVRMEDPRYVTGPNPLEREIWLCANLTTDPSAGVAAGRSAGARPGADGGNEDEEEEEEEEASSSSTFLVRGIVDRIDLVPAPGPARGDGGSEMCLRIIDYKTGSAPNLKYSPRVNRRIADEAFWQLKVYALLAREMTASSGGGGGPHPNLRNGPDLRTLRIMYLTSEDGTGRSVDLDLGETEEERDGVLREVHEDLAGVWAEIDGLVRSQDPGAFAHCDRGFCWCHRVRPLFVPGSLWEGENAPRVNVPEPNR